MRTYLIFLFVFLFGNILFSSNIKKLNKGFEALWQYDYFKAKSIFYNCNKKEINSAAAYGLATIYHRQDNPFFNLDSALKYIQLSNQTFIQKPITYNFQSIQINQESIFTLADSITLKQFKRAKSNNTIFAYETFLKQNTIAKPSLRLEAIQMRDELAFMKMSQINKSDTTIFFMLKYPLSSFMPGAQMLLERQIYFETTVHQKPEEWISFLAKHPNNVMVNEAYEKLFDYYRKKQSIGGLTFFVNKYPKAPQVLEAWKLLFSLSVKAYTSEELKKFLNQHPQFPLKNSILKELELNQITLYPFQKDDFIGFINDKAQVIIEAQFDQVSDFFEGLSVVSKNDSVYFINKEKENPFNQFYADAFPFKNGMAAVKQNNKWFFINRQGQVISKPYDELNEISNQIYVFKQNGKYGALNQYGQVLIAAKFDKLGDFKNDVAYFVNEGKYGFVTVKGKLYKEEFEWISDFDAQQLAIFKLGNKFGLIDMNGKKILENEFDQIIKASEDYFMLVNNNLYGFYSSKACYVAPLIFDYIKEKPIDYYCKSHSFKLHKKDEIGIMDANGKMEVNFGAFKEIDFLTNGLILARKKNKFGFIDKKLNVVIPFKYSEAESFSDSVSVVKLKNEYQLINLNGKELFVSEQPIQKYNQLYFIIEGENKTLINKRGELVLTDVAGIQQINNNLMLVTFSSDEMRLVKD